MSRGYRCGNLTPMLGFRPMLDCELGLRYPERRSQQVRSGAEIRERGDVMTGSEAVVRDEIERLANE